MTWAYLSLPILARGAPYHAITPDAIAFKQRIYVRLIACLAIALAVTGCATGNPVQSPNVKIASLDDVRSCQYLDTVYGTSSWYGLFAEAGIENARLSAFDKAQKLGATHLAWEQSLSQAHGSSSVAAKVYRC